MHHEGLPDVSYRATEVKAAPEVVVDAVEKDPAVIDTEHNREHTPDPTPESAESTAAREARKTRDARRIAEIRDRLLALQDAVPVSENYHKRQAELVEKPKDPQLGKRYTP